MLSKLTNIRLLLAAAIATFGLTPVVDGHSWIEQLRNINSKGQYVGDYGYPRGFKAKTDPGYDGTVDMIWLLPEATEKTTPFISEDSVLCGPKQRKPEQSKPEYPRLKTAPGQFIAMRYTENGHVSLIGADDSSNTNNPKPKKGGTVFIYGTTEPKEDEKLATVLRWTKDGKGGNKAGVLLATNNYDDNRCYESDNHSKISDERHKEYPNFVMGQVSNGPGNTFLSCESNVALPKDAAPGKPYTFYWVWQWNTDVGKDPKLPTGKDEYYTTCIDVDVVDTVETATDEKSLKYPMGPQQDVWSMAVSDYASRTALYTDAIAAEVGPVFKTDKPASGTASGSPMASATGPAAGGPMNSPTGSAAAPPASQATPPASKPTSAQSTLATVTKPSAGSGTGADSIPTMTTRPGRPLPDTTAAPAPAPGSGNGTGAGAGADSDPVTITDTVLVTVTAPAVTAPAGAAASHLPRHLRRQALNYHA
jgi:hypothetical protein